MRKGNLAGATIVLKGTALVEWLCWTECLRLKFHRWTRLSARDLCRLPDARGGFEEER
ncbi:MAG: hypothetical protein ACLU4N_22390 [Butyricimonas faecihominis]